MEAPFFPFLRITLDNAVHESIVVILPLPPQLFSFLRSIFLFGNGRAQASRLGRSCVCSGDVGRLHIPLFWRGNISIQATSCGGLPIVPKVP